MSALPENWVSGYDGQRWFFQYEPTGMIQYHFPQEGDEYAEFMLDVGTGPIKLTPEDSLAIERETKRRSISGFDHDTKSGLKTSGSKKEKKKSAVIEEEFGMSATGYFDSSAYFPDNFNSISPLGDDESEDIAVELPESTRSPVGFVAELATQETVKCAEELAPVELDATSYAPAPIQTNMGPEPAELPTYRTPVEDKTLLISKPTQPAMRPVDSYPLTSASFAYPPLNSGASPANGVSPGAMSIGRKPVPSSANSADVGQNKYQPWNPAQGVVAQQSQTQNKPPETLPQTSILQNQDSELGGFGRKNSQNHELSMLGNVPPTLAPPTEPRKPTAAEASPTKDPETSSIPAVLQPAHHLGEVPNSLGTTNQQVIPGSQARHDSISVPVSSHHPSVLKPGGSQSSSNPQGSEGKYAQGSILPHHPPEQVIQASTPPIGQPNITKVNTLPNHLPSPHSKMNGSPGFLFFHEIPSNSNSSNHGTNVCPEDNPKPNVAPQTSNSNPITSQSHTSVDEQIPVVAPLNFVKRHSSKSSQVSSIGPETPLVKPALTGSDEISEVISVISSFTPQETSLSSSQSPQHPVHTSIGDNSKPSPTSMSGGAGVPTNVATGAKPQQINPQAINMQQPSTASPLHNSVTSSPANISKPTAATTTPMSQSNGITSPSNAGMPTTQPNVQANHHPSPLIQGSSSQNQHPSSSLPSQVGNSGKFSMSPGPLKPQGTVSTPLPPHASTASVPGRPPSQASNVAHANPPQFGAHNNTIHNMNHAVQQTQVNMPASHVNGPTQIPVATSVQQALHHPLGQSNGRPHSIIGAPTFGHSQSAIPKPQLQHSVPAGQSSQQPTVQPSAGHQVAGSNTAQVSSQPPYQHSSPVTQSVSPIESQVSSPAQSIASLHVSQSSTPASTFATMNNHTGPHVSANQTNIAPIRPSSVPAHALSQQIGSGTPPVGFHSKPSTPVGIAHAQTSPTPNPSAKPYPMLPGQITPLPSQVGSAPFPPPPQQSIQTTPGGPAQHHAVLGQANPVLNPPQGSLVYGPALSQAQMKPPQHQNGGFQPSANQPQPQHMVSYPPTGQPHNSQSAGSSPAVGQQQMFPPPPSVAQAQQLPQSPGVTSPITTAPGKPFNSAQATAALTDAGKGMKKWAKKVWKNPGLKQSAVGFGGAVMAESMGVSGAAGAKLANSLFASATRPPLAHAQTAPAQAHGVPAAAPQHQQVQIGQQHQPGKPPPLHPQPNHHPGQPQLGHPQLGHVQPGHPQSGYPQSAHPHQPGHPQPGHPQPAHPQLGHQPGHPQLGHPQPGHPQPGHPQPGHPQPGHSQPGHPQPGHSQPGHPQLGHQPGHPQSSHSQPGHSQPGHPQPGHPQPGHPQPGHPQPGPPHPTQLQSGQIQLSYAQSGHAQLGHQQPGHPQPAHQPVGAQMSGRPPIAQNPQLNTGVAVNFNAQAQAQVGFNQQQQHPSIQPTMVNIPLPPPPPMTNFGAHNTQVQAQGQVNVDAANLATAAVILGSAVGSAFHQNNSQPQHGHGQSGQAPHSESHGGGNHGYATEHHGGAHEQTYGYGLSVPPPPPAIYTDNSYMATDTAYTDNSSYAVNNTYVENTEVINNTIYIDNSTSVVTDMTYNNTDYADTTQYSGTEVTSVAVDVDVSSVVYTDTGATGFSMDESVTVASSSDIAAGSGDYSGSGWGDFFDF